MREKGGAGGGGEVKNKKGLYLAGTFRPTIHRWRAVLIREYEKRVSVAYKKISHRDTETQRKLFQSTIAPEIERQLRLIEAKS